MTQTNLTGINTMVKPIMDKVAAMSSKSKKKKASMKVKVAVKAKQ